MHWDTFDRLELRDFEANRKKIRILSAEISRLEAEIGELPAESTNDVLKDDWHEFPLPSDP
jgi:hypothetical protein